MTRIKSLSRLVPFALALPAFAAPAPAKGPRQELKELTSQLQASPSDQALRERIIALAVKLKPAPALPEEAERRMARGKAGFKTAEKSEDYKAASEEFLKAVLAAPWWADAYFNLGQAQEKAGELAGARASLALYLKAAPNAADAKAVREKVYELEFMEEKKKARASDLAGKWGYEEDIRKGKYTIEIYKDSSGSYQGRPREDSFSGTTDDGKDSYRATVAIEQFTASPAGGVYFTDRTRSTYASGTSMTWATRYSLSLSADGRTLTGNKTWEWVGTGHKKDGPVTLLRME